MIFGTGSMVLKLRYNLFINIRSDQGSILEAVVKELGSAIKENSS